MNPTDYFDACERHDWYYAFSDDPSVYRKGLEHGRELESIALHSATLNAIYVAFWNYHHSGPAFGTDRAPMPMRPEGQLTIF